MNKTVIYIVTLLILGSFGLLAQDNIDITGVALIRKDTMWNTFAAGGWVMWPILLCMVIGIGYGIERYFGLSSSAVFPKVLRKNYEEVFQQYMNGKKNVQLNPLITDGASEGEKLFARFLKRDVDNLRNMEQILQEYVEESQWRLQKNIKPLGHIAQIAPLMGLFGTVLGMIEAFESVAAQGMGKPELLANGMAIALLTTGFGLGVAIPASFFYSFFMEKSTRYTMKLYNLLHELLLQRAKETK